MHAESDNLISNFRQQINVTIGKTCRRPAHSGRASVVAQTGGLELSHFGHDAVSHFWGIREADHNSVMSLPMHFAFYRCSAARCFHDQVRKAKVTLDRPLRQSHVLNVLERDGCLMNFQMPRRIRIERSDSTYQVVSNFK